MNIDDITIAEVLARYDINPGDGSRCACPVHHGEGRNFSYKGCLYYCWVCGARGNAISLVAEIFGIRRWQAAQKIKVDFGAITSGEAPDYREAKRLREAQRLQRHINERFESLWRELAELRRLLYRQRGEDCEQVRYLDRILDRLESNPGSFTSWNIDMENLMINLYSTAQD